MARSKPSETVFLRHDNGTEKKDVYFRINPQAIRFQQGAKASVVDTLSGFFLERLVSGDPQYNNTLADLTIEATTGIAYQQELQRLKWIWNHAGDRKKDGSPVDIYFFNLIELPEYQQVVRSTKQAYLIHISNFAYDDTVQSFSEIRLTLRCKILRDVFWGTNGENVETPTGESIPNLNHVLDSVRLNKLDPNSLKNPLGDVAKLPQLFTGRSTKLNL